MARRQQDPSKASRQDRRSARMYVRTQNFGTTDSDLRFLQRCGVRHKAGIFPFHPGRGWELDDLLREKERYEAFGLTLDMSAIPIPSNFPTSSITGRARNETEKSIWYAR